MEEIQLSVMVISSQKFCDRLKPCLLNIVDKSYGEEIKVKLAESVVDIVKSAKPYTEADFVTIVVDTTVPNAVDKCRSDISLIMPLFVASRICIVNGACREASIESAQSLIEFADQFKIPYFNGHIMDNKSCRTTAERIMKLAVFATGFETGISGLIPTPGDLGLIS